MGWYAVALACSLPLLVWAAGVVVGLWECRARLRRCVSVWRRPLHPAVVVDSEADTLDALPGAALSPLSPAGRALLSHNALLYAQQAQVNQCAYHAHLVQNQALYARASVALASAAHEPS